MARKTNGSAKKEQTARVLHPEDCAGQMTKVAEWKQVLRDEGGVPLWRGLQEMQVSAEQGSAGRKAIESLLGYLQPRLDQT